MLHWDYGVFQVIYFYQERSPQRLYFPLSGVLEALFRLLSLDAEADSLFLV